MFYTIYTILMSCAIITISTLRRPIHLRRGQENAMPMVAIRGRRRSLCAMLQGPVKRGAQGAQGARSLPRPPSTGAFRRPVMAAAIRGPQQGLASRAGGWVRAMKKGGENPALPVLML